MNRCLAFLPWVAVAVLQTGGEASGFRLQVMQPLSLALFLGVALGVRRRHRRREASDLELAVVGYLFLGVLAFWWQPAGLGRVFSSYPLALLYACLFFTAAVPPLWGREPFTGHFARRQAPEAVWQTGLFQEINRRLTAFWAVLFALSALSALAPEFWPALDFPWGRVACNYAVPAILLGGVGIAVTRWYPAYRQRRLGLGTEGSPPEAAPAPGPPSHSPISEKSQVSSSEKESDQMPDKNTVVAINASPHEGFGSTSQMLALLRENLDREGLALEEIYLSRHHLEHCAGCALCLEKGSCWIRDDHRDILKRVLAADAIILASPVYFMNVTGRMKTFLDRSLGYGHRPRGTWKPGLAVSVSAGYGESWVAQYLSQMLKVFGSFAIGQLTAIAVSPGQFLGLDAVQARAGDLARDLARAVREGRRYPATDLDLHYWQFMGNLIEENRDFMKADYEHWERLGLFESFEAYVGQSRAPGAEVSPEARKAWIKSLAARQQTASREAPPEPESGPRRFSSLKELFKAMPQALNPQAAAGLKVTYQFEVSGSENFIAHLQIDNGAATFQEGPAPEAQVIIKTPAEVWLAICQGEMDGSQAFMTGKYQVEGDLSLLMKMETLFSR
ncbi:MAG: NAD(P)H-dependent oxidoreductase [Thermodesulfobacteriota bacterium]